MAALENEKNWHFWRWKQKLLIRFTIYDFYNSVGLLWFCRHLIIASYATFFVYKGGLQLPIGNRKFGRNVPRALHIEILLHLYLKYLELRFPIQSQGTLLDVLYLRRPEEEETISRRIGQIKGEPLRTSFYLCKKGHLSWTTQETWVIFAFKRKIVFQEGVTE